MRTLRPSSYTGLDLNQAGIAFWRKRHTVPGLDFVQGDSENLPFEEQSFDAVINIEAAHCYPRFPRFLAEVARVLRPGGHFLYTDLCRREDIAEWEAALPTAHCGWCRRKSSMHRCCAGWRQTLSGRSTSSVVAVCQRSWTASVANSPARQARRSTTYCEVAE
jgi:ubiquinone/menaquinone biosynthesis C-methylase UbiE